MTIIRSNGFYLPYERLLEDDEGEYVDENGVLIIFSKVRIHVGDYVYTKLYEFIRREDFIKYLRRDLDASADYMMKEYFLALGQENMTSKFLHLFSVIEFAEK